MLKIDEKILKELNPNSEVVCYISTPFKSGRMAEFEDGTKVLIETKSTDGEYLKMIKKMCTEHNTDINILNTFKDKNGREITHYEIVKAE